MHTLVQTPQEIFTLPMHLTVPLFQRPYVWDEEEQLAPLWSDIRRVTELRMGQGSNSATHFLGAVVLQQQISSMGAVGAYAVIDGQQRLTTLQILMDATTEVLRALDQDALAQQLIALTHNASHFGLPEDQILKVQHTNKDRGAFHEVMNAAPPIDYQGLHHRGPDWPMTPERARFEATSLQIHGRIALGLVSEVLHFDNDRHIIALEDLSDHTVWRTALNEGRMHDGAAAAVGRYLAGVAAGTSALGLEREELARRIADSVNPQLCQITEDLVFTEPVVDAGRNSVLPANEPDAAELAADEEFVTAMGRAKWLFMTKAEALIHGDLHTGSVMVRSPEGTTECDSVRVFDSEFAFYGPVAFDLGALWANYTIAAARAYALGKDERAQWALGLITQTWEAFEEEFRRRWPERLDPRVWREPFLEELLTTWQQEAWLFAAAKMSRRIVGAAKTTDIETLPEELREGAARGVLRTARQAVRGHHTDSRPERFATLATDILPRTATRD